MKQKIITAFVTCFVLVASGCGGGGDAIFSPDPSIAQVPGGGETPDGDTGGGGGGSGSVNTTQSEGGQASRDCFLDGFCLRTCRDASECPEGFSCIMKVCTFDCQTDAECGTGGKCNDVGLCEVAEGGSIPACTADLDCGDGRFCNAAGQCEQIPVLLGCQADVDCPSGQYCDSSHSCQMFPTAGVACSTDADCPGNYYCDASGGCLQECRSDYQCEAGKACNANGRCVVPGAPAKLLSFSFGALGADTDPTGPMAFGSASFKLDHVVITAAGRNQILTSPRFRLISSAEF